MGGAARGVGRPKGKLRGLRGVWWTQRWDWGTSENKFEGSQKGN